MEEPEGPRLGRYAIFARIAMGGMAEIFVGRQTGAGGFSRLVVLKRIMPHLAEEPDFVRMFLDEARLASQIDHTNVVRIFDVDSDAGAYFIAMEYIDGLTIGAILRRATKEGRWLPYWVAGEIVAQACDGLHAAHELRGDDGTTLGLVHRDVSPQNLMVSRRGVVKLVDFGIAKAQGSGVKTRTGNVKGKYPYMSPEQVKAEPLDRRTDIFSLGTVFFELVTGTRLFARGGELLVLKAICDDPVPLAHEVNPDVPPEIGTVIARCLQRKREDRFPDAATMGAAVRRALETLGKPTSPATLSEFLEERCAELLEARDGAVREVGQLVTATSSVPKIRGFDDRTPTNAELDAPTVANQASASSPPSTPSGAARKARPATPSEPRLELRSEDDAGPVGRGLVPRRNAGSQKETASTVTPAEAGVQTGSRSRRAWKVALAVLVLAAVAVGAAGYWVFGRSTRPAGPPLVFGAHPDFPAETIREGYAPLVGYLEGRLDRPVEIKVASSYDAIRDDLVAGKVHFANLSPLLFVRTRAAAPGIQPLAMRTQEGARTFEAYIVARDDSGIEDAADLLGRRFCYVDRSSTSGFLFARQYMRAHGIDPDRDLAGLRFSGTHIDVLRDILAGRCDAGATYSDALLSARNLELAASKIRLVAVTGHAPLDVICASPKLPADQARAIKQAFLDFDPQRDLGRKIVSPIFRIDGFEEARPEDFEFLVQAARAEKLIE